MLRFTSLLKRQAYTNFLNFWQSIESLDYKSEHWISSNRHFQCNRSTIPDNAFKSSEGSSQASASETNAQVTIKQTENSQFIQYMPFCSISVDTSVPALALREKIRPSLNKQSVRNRKRFKSSTAQSLDLLQFLILL